MDPNTLCDEELIIWESALKLMEECDNLLKIAHAGKLPERVMNGVLDVRLRLAKLLDDNQ